jgi:hypothetical protein
MELNLNQRRKGLEAKIPDVRKTVGVVEFLLERKRQVRSAGPPFAKLAGA